VKIVPVVILEILKTVIVCALSATINGVVLQIKIFAPSVLKSYQIRLIGVANVVEKSNESITQIKH